MFNSKEKEYNLIDLLCHIISIISLAVGVDRKRGRYGGCQFHHRDGGLPSVCVVWVRRLQASPRQDRVPGASPSLHHLL